MNVNEYPIFLSGTVSLLVSAGLSYIFSRPRWRWRMLDHPNERSLHTTPTPRVGGIAIVTSVVLGGSIAYWAAYTSDARVGWIACAAIAVAVTALFDDRKDLSAILRLTIHFIAAAMLVLGGATIATVDLPGVSIRLLPIATTIVSLLAIVWMINLYNFMDGMDGLAAGMALIGFSTFAWFGVAAQQPLFAALNAVVAAAAFGFLLFNFPPARIFMGDTGSSTLGLLAIAMALWGIDDGLFPPWVPLLVFSPFIVDATSTLARRAYRREPLWRAHRTHFYQRLVQTGLGHRRVAALEYVLMLLCAASAIAGVHAQVMTQWIILGAWVVTYAGLLLVIGRVAPLAGAS